MSKIIKLYTVFSHTLSSEQFTDAQERFGVSEVVVFSDTLLKIWSNIPADKESIKPYLVPLWEHLKDVTKDDYVLVQGDFGATYIVVEWVKSQGATAIYATTERNTVEKMLDGKSIKTSVFSHVRYRRYGE